MLFIAQFIQHLQSLGAKEYCKLVERARQINNSTVIKCYRVPGKTALGAHWVGEGLEIVLKEETWKLGR